MQRTRRLLSLALALGIACGSSDRRRNADPAEDRGRGTPKRATASHAAASADSPKPGYRAFEVAGFQVLVNEAVFAHPAESDRLLAAIRASLDEAERLMGSATLDKIRKTRIWAEWESHDKARVRGPAEFHRSREWLKANGYDPDKVNSVEVSDTRAFLRASASEQPQLILHELVHAYDALILGGADPSVHLAFKQAGSSGRYDKVGRIGSTELQRAYALSDASEYLAEISEAYFGMNDYFPHVREQLASHDPEGMAVATRLWGPRGVRPTLQLSECSAMTRTQLDGRATAVLVTNARSVPVDLVWLDKEGRSVPMTTIAPSKQIVQTSYQGHVFSVSASGGCVGTFAAAAEVSVLTVR